MADGVLHDGRRLEGHRSRLRRGRHHPANGGQRVPGGWDYSLHLGEVGGGTVLRYDNAHERTKGHERHTVDDVETIEFPGMLALYDRFKREAAELSSVPWDWPE